MKHGIQFLAVIVTFAAMISGVVGAENAAPVKIVFDEESPRQDLLTDEILPNYTQAVRGSFLFFLDRLDKPEVSFNFYHDRVNRVNISVLNFVSKIDGDFDMWRLVYKNGNRNTPRVHHKAVSFIPLGDDGQPKSRVYVLINDLSYIEWGDDEK